MNNLDLRGAIDQIQKTFLLEIDSARDLRSRKFSRSPKTFVQLNIDTQTYATHVAERSIHPRWQEKFTILVQEEWFLEFYVIQDKSRELGRCSLPALAFWDSISSSPEPLGLASDTRKDEVNRLMEAEICDLQLTDATGHSTGSRLRIRIIEILSSSPRIKHLEAQVEKVQFDVLSLPRIEKASTKNLLTRSESSNLLLSSIYSVFETISNIKPIIDRLAKVHPYADLTWQILTVVYSAAQTQVERDVKVLDLVTTIQDAFRWLNALDPLAKIELLEAIITEIFQLSCNCGLFIHWYMGTKFSGRVVRDVMSDTDDRIAFLKRSFERLTKNLSMALSIQTALVTSNVERAVEDQKYKLIRDHLVCEPAVWDPTLTCQPGTRENIIHDIISWLETKRDQNILWLAGLAGSGKSTIAHTIASSLESTSRLGGCFFFARHLSTRNDAKYVMTTLAHALASFDHSIRTSIADAVEKNINVGRGPLRRQFLDLIIEPLKQYKGEQMIVIVLDALDECASPALREDLLTVLSQDSAQLPPFVRIFLTARPESDIEEALGQNARCQKLMIDLDSENNIKDITAYVTFQMERISLARPNARLPTTWPGDNLRRIFVQHSAGLFIWASTACSFIRASFSPEKALSRLLSAGMPTSAAAAIDSLYATALASVEGWEDEDFIPAYQVVVGTIIALNNPLPASTLQELLGPELDGVPFELVTDSLGCVLTNVSGKPIRVLHPSFSEYLTSSKRCKDPQTFIDMTVQHHRITTRCLLRMEHTLEYNICGLPVESSVNLDIPNIATLVERHIPEDIQYSCRFWTEHGSKLPPEKSISTLVLQFLSTHALHWMEVMSLIGLSSHIVPCLHVIRVWAQGTGVDDLINFTYDLERFAQTFATVIAEAAMHIYVSALPFTPLATGLWKKILARDSEKRGLSVIAGPDEQWPICLRTFDGHTDWVQAVAFSPSGKLVSGSDDATVRVWDIPRAVSILVLNGPGGGFISVGFSPSGNKIIAGSKAGTIFVWDSTLGELLTTLEGHRLGVSSVFFTSDRSRAISGSFDTTIRFWDTNLGTQMGDPVDTPQSEVSTIALSPQGDMIASGSYDKSLYIWSSSTREKLLGPLEHSSAITSTVFTLFQDMVAAACRDGSVQFTDTSTGKRARSLAVSTRTVSSIAFSPDGTILGVACNDHTVSFWDVTDGQLLIGPLQGHSGPVTSIVFSADGSMVASGSHDNTIRLWDVLESKEKTDKSQTEGHKDQITVIKFSADGSKIATGDSAGSICVWGAADGKVLLKIFEAHSQAISTLAFSPKEEKLVSGAHDQFVKVWSTTSGAELLGPLDAHGHIVSASAISVDGTTIATGGYDRCVYFWDISTGELLSETPLEDFNHWVVEVTFSDDGSYLRSIDYNGEVLLWDLKAHEITDEVPDGTFSDQMPMGRLYLEENGWVIDTKTETRKRVCWIPHGHRGDIHASYDRTIVIGNEVGLVTIVDVKNIISSN